MKQLIAANWKMFKTNAESKAMIIELAKIINGTIPNNRQALIFPSFTNLSTVSTEAKQIPELAVGSQNIYPAKEGAFTGEISPAMLRDCGASWVLIGHSERRHVIGESNELVTQKTEFAVTENFNIILCIGETLEQRENGELEKILAWQLSALNNISDQDFSKIVIAYEPVWAIGTGKTASLDDIAEAHAIIRNLLQKVTPKAAEIKILYGGSVKPDNAKDILAVQNVNGLLIGGASLEATSFAKIILT